MQWVLPEYIQDVLPEEAARLESLRARFLEVCRVRGYQLVVPPLLEYLDALLTGAGQDLNLRTFKLVDQLSGRSLGVRADITPQVARIDAHLLNRQGVSRLCYCGSVLHALPASLNSGRELLQLGAEIYGHAGIAADAEVIGLLHALFELAGIRGLRIDLGHIGLFRELAALAGLSAEHEELLFGLLQSKDVPALQDLLAHVDVAPRAALMALPSLYGGPEVLQRARAVLPAHPPVLAALEDLEALRTRLPGLPISFDLADLRGYHYHSGVVFAAYGAGAPSALALGGRYDSVGRAFGRARPATGFSLDLRELALYAERPASAGAILAPDVLDDGLLSVVRRLREQGEIVMLALPGHAGGWREAGCDRQLLQRDGQWVVEALDEER